MRTEFASSRIEALKRKLAAREGKAEFKENCTHLRAEIARLDPNGPMANFIRENGPEGQGEQDL